MSDGFRPRSRRLALGLVLLLTTAAPVRAVDLTDLLARMTEAYGGAERLAEIEGYRLRGDLLALTDGVNGKVDIEIALDGSMRVEITYPHRTEVRIVAGPLTWNGGKRSQRPSQRPMSDSMKLQYHRLAAPFELLRLPIEELTLAGESNEGWPRIEVRWNSRLRTVFEIDDESATIRRMRGLMTTEDGEELEFVAEASDFRRVDGVLLPFRVTTFLGDQVAGETTITRWDFVDDFDSSRFLPAGTRGDF